MNTIPNTPEKKMKLTERQYDVLVKFDSYGEYALNYRHLELRTKFDRKTLQEIIKELRAMELLEYQRGLMNDDGEVCGSGFACNYKKQTEINKLISDFEDSQK